MYILDICLSSDAYVVGGDNLNPQLKVYNLADPANPIVRATLTTLLRAVLRIGSQTRLACLPAGGQWDSSHC